MGRVQPQNDRVFWDAHFDQFLPHINVGGVLLEPVLAIVLTDGLQPIGTCETSIDSG